MKYESEIIKYLQHYSLGVARDKMMNDLSSTIPKSTFYRILSQLEKQKVIKSEENNLGKTIIRPVLMETEHSQKIIDKYIAENNMLCDEEYETMFIGYVFVHEEQRGILEEVGVECFTNKTNRSLYQKMREAYLLGNRDIKSAIKMTHDERTQFEYIIDSYSDYFDIKQVIKTLKRMAYKRQIAEKIYDTFQEFISGSSTGQLVNSISDIDLLVRGVEQEDEESFTEKIDDIVGMIKDGSAGIIQPQLIYTGRPMLDNWLGGIAPGRVLVIAGRPGLGKTTFALNVALTMNEIMNDPILFFSLEMDEAELFYKVCSFQHEIPLEEIIKYQLDLHQLEMIERTAHRLKKSKLEFDCNAYLSPAILRQKIAKIKNRYGKVGAVFIDYLQLMVANGNNNGKEYERLSDITRSVKLIAKEFDVPIFLLSQLNRESEKGGGREKEHKRPRMDNLRGSGTIEQDADVVMLIHSESHYHHEDADKLHDWTLYIEKNRMGRTGYLEHTFLKYCNKIVENEKRC